MAAYVRSSTVAVVAKELEHSSCRYKQTKTEEPVRGVDSAINIAASTSWCLCLTTAPIERAATGAPMPSEVVPIDEQVPLPRAHLLYLRSRHEIHMTWRASFEPFASAWILWWILQYAVGAWMQVFHEFSAQSFATVYISAAPFLLERCQYCRHFKAYQPRLDSFMTLWPIHSFFELQMVWLYRRSHETVLVFH